MVFTKTKNRRFIRLFLIVLIPICALGISVSAYSLITKASGTSLVKDESVNAQSIAEQESPDEVSSIYSADDKPVITTYIVAKGDTLSSIAQKFSISTNTLLWANDLDKKSVIKQGQKLTILPVSGIVYKVKKGDNIGSIANKFDASIEEIVSFNDLEDNKTINIGMELIIPNAELPLATETKKIEQKKEVVKQVITKPVEEKKETVAVATQKIEEKVSSNDIDADDMVNNGAVPKVAVSGVDTENYFKHPVPGSNLSQGLHGYNAVDFAAPLGTPIYAAADGVVIIEKGANKWYGGYGNHIVIEHDNGTQTLYSHNSKNLVNVGDEVKQGQNIALVGSTGRSTGNHLHFEVRGGVNPWVGTKKFTKF